MPPKRKADGVPSGAKHSRVAAPVASEDDYTDSSDDAEEAEDMSRTHSVPAYLPGI